MIEPTFLSLFPPLIAVALAIGTRRIIPSLAAGVAVGIGLIAAHQAQPASAAVRLTVEAFWQSVGGRDHLLVLAFSLLMGAMVGVLEHGGAMVALVVRVCRSLGFDDVDRSGAPSPKDRNRAQRLIAAAGLAIFFDDYANTLLVGGTMRTTADRYRLSREKLAYLVDSTSAPIAGLAVISTWAAVEMAYMADGLRGAGMESANAFELFWLSIPYRFYPIFALVMVGITVVTGSRFWTDEVGRSVGVAATAAAGRIRQHRGAFIGLASLGRGDADRFVSDQHLGDLGMDRLVR